MGTVGQNHSIYDFENQMKSSVKKFENQIISKTKI